MTPHPQPAYWVTSAHTGEILSGPFPDYETASKEADRQKQQSVGGYGRFNIVVTPSGVGL